MRSLSLEHYRCFTPESGATVEIGPGLTAFVGTNNSGKTTFLRSFFEMRELFGRLGNPGELSNIALRNAYSTTINGVRDPEELRLHGLEGPIRLEVDTGFVSNDQHLRVRLTEQQAPAEFLAEFVFGENRDVVAEKKDGDLLLPDGAQVSIPTIAAQLASLGDTLYFGPHRSTIGQSNADYFDIPVGGRFIAAWDRWKTGNSVTENRTVNLVTETIARIFGFNQLEIAAADSDTDLQVVVDGNPHRLRELGAGLSQFIITVCVAAIRRPAFILIDEPESSLHPPLQVEFLSALEMFAKEGVIFCTHSIGLARCIAERVYSFRKTTDGITVAPLARTPRLTEFLGELSFAAWSEMGAKTVLLVEGVTDVRVAKEWLRLFGAEKRVVVLPLGGSQLVRDGVGAELREVTALSDRVFALVDSERTGPEDEPPKERRKFVEVCLEVGITSHLTDLRATENYLADAAIKKVKGGAFRALGPYEQLMDLSPRWRKGDNWRIAIEMTREQLLESDVGSFLARVAADAS